MRVSIIIPTLNEAHNLPGLLKRLREGDPEKRTEIIVVDAYSKDDTKAVAQDLGANVYCSAGQGRAIQMNYGAELAQHELLYFVHADTLPPLSYLGDLEQAIKENYSVGCFRYIFDTEHPLLKINAFFTRFPMLWCRGGDQSLFITSELFKKMNGFREDYVIMEDFEFIKRIKKDHDFRIIPKNMIVSARKYGENSYFRVQIANLVVFNMYRFGYTQEQMVNTYRRLLKGIKNNFGSQGIVHDRG